MWLKISLFSNLALAGSLACVWLTGKPSASVSPATLPVAPMAKVVEAAVITNPSVAELKPFRWSQLDAKDYHDYVKNLRNIGCPEPSIRAIVTADVHAAFNVHRQKLEQQLSEMARQSWASRLATVPNNIDIQGEIAQLPHEEANKISDLLGIKMDPGLAEAESTSVNESPSPEEKTVSMPMALQDIDLTPLDLDSNQLQIIDGLRRGFVSKLALATNDPNDPAYLANWQKAQPETDSRLRGLMGDSVFQKYQMLIFRHNLNADNQ